MTLTTSASCPVCEKAMQFSWETADIPHFGEAMIIAGVCDCGYRHSDTILLSQKEPVRFSMVVTGIEDLNARVIRSSSGTLRIPELGVDIEPGFASECYISNVEGVLDRVEGIVEFATRSAREANSAEAAGKGEEILEKISLARQGRFPLTLILEDPLGNSAIDCDKAERILLSPEQAAGLKTGMIIVDV
ncbi:MAG TPA: ZPR1 zinc finger domain-containing protein [Methanothrix sp.]|nr:ZPR1 zinc finger domain-containing protein [Methanothrix sp.]HOV82825.1 ZPR1 zinc finger domain-containing protein [Methanothrix sp.]HPC90243.1 ZPR1 zinc finger domain-containing protein [Methanothrix sp.]HQE88156.1 ZPR1 zinc finger domain-containing protein [Methanothrix sp.]HQI68599.1 ZPR1 zinc finger domain-containing protein [Methanothrix sp.]